MKKRIPYFVLSAHMVLLSACLKDENIKGTFTGYEPVSAFDDWEISSPENENMDPGILSQAYRLVYEDDRFTMGRSLLVIRHGKLVCEAYPHDKDDINRIENIQSMTKSFTSILTGIALQKKLLDSLNQTLFSIYPEQFSQAPEKKSITLRQTLTMTTGIDFDNGEHTKEIYTTGGNSVEYVLSRKLNYEPGLVYNYHDGAPHLISYAIQKRAGRTLSDFGNEFLFKTLGITDWKWESAKDGVTFGAFSLYMKPRDLAKVGQLLAQNGKWKGQQLVDSAWIAAATFAHVDTRTGGAPYGYYFWIYPALKSFAALGHGGQAIMVFPEKELVIVYTAWGYTSGDYFDNFNELAQLISASCR